MTKVYVGGIPDDTKESELDDAFTKYGRIESVWLARNPPGFAFVTFEDARDADDAIRSMDGKDFLGRRIRVEASRTRDDRGRRDRRRSRSRSRSRGRRGRGTSHPGYRRGEFRVNVSNLSSRVSWQDLKDFLRRGGEVCYADARNGEGVADFLTRDDMDRAIRKLDGEEFEGRRIRIDADGRGRSRSRSRGKRSRSRSRSRRRSRSRSRSAKRRRSGSR